MARQTYLKNAAILTATGLVLRAVGMVFRIYVAGRIGAEGMGLYQLVLTVYNLGVTFSTAGITICATRLASFAMAHGKAPGQAMRRVLSFGSVLGCVCGVGMFLLAQPLSDYVMHDARGALSLCVLAPSLPFMASSAALRGYFISLREVRPNAKAQLFEQFVRIAFVAIIIDFAMPYGMGAVCAAVLAGNTVSEILSWCYMLLAYRKINRTQGAQSNASAPQQQDAPPSVYHILTPIAANQYLTAFLRTFENVIIPSSLALFTKSRELALSQFGALKGMAMPVLFFPFSFLTTLSTLLMPEITDAFLKKQNKTLEHLIRRTMLITCVLSAMAGGVFALFAQEIGQLFYHSAEIGFYLAVLGPLAPFMYVESMVDSILKGMDEQLATFKYSIIDSLSRIVLIYLLVPRFGMQGFLVVMLVSNLLTSLLNVRRLFCVTGLAFDWSAWVAKPLFAVCLSAVAEHFVFAPLLAKALPLWAWTVVGALLTAAAFCLVLWLVGGISMKALQKKRG